MIREKWDRKRVISKIKHLHKIGEDLSPRRISKIHGKLFKATLYYFGEHKGWQKAIEKAIGIDYRSILRQKQWTKEEILQNLKKKYEQGEDISYKNMRKHDPRLVVACENNFGNYRNAVEAAGIDYKQIALAKNKFWTKERIISNIKLIFEMEGNISSRYMQIKHQDLFSVASKKFGSWGKAVTEAGFNYNEVKRALLKYKCKDGARVISIYEMQVANWLFEHNINYEYNPSISQKRKFRADFKIGRFYIEVLGYPDREAYMNKKREAKMVFAGEQGPGFIFLEEDENFKKYERYYNQCNKPVYITVTPRGGKIFQKYLNQRLGFLVDYIT
jgi:soluble P-type ATPase